MGVITVEASRDQFPLPNVLLVSGIQTNFPISNLPTFPRNKSANVDEVTIIDAELSTEIP